VGWHDHRRRCCCHFCCHPHGLPCEVTSLTTLLAPLDLISRLSASSCSLRRPRASTHVGMARISHFASNGRKFTCQ
jgi:hypothetical protein